MKTVFLHSFILYNNVRFEFEIGGMEVDLPHLYQTVQSLGGLKEVIEKKKWQKVADGMKIPRSAQDRVTKLDDIYCKYLLPYDTLSQGLYFYMHFKIFTSYIIYNVTIYIC